MQTLNLAQPYADSKTIVDKPTVKNADATLGDFNALERGSSMPNIGEIVNYLNADFVSPPSSFATIPIDLTL